MKTNIIISIFILIFVYTCVAQDSKENADFKLAVNLYNDKMYDLALEQFTMFVNLYPNSSQAIDARFYLGLTQVKLGKHELARYTFQNFALTYADNIKAPEAWMYVAESYAAMKNDKEAAMAYERVKTFHPQSKLAPKALLKASEYYLKINERENALRVLRILSQEYTTEEVLPARNILAEMFLNAEQFEQARLESKKVIDATKDINIKSKALLLHAEALIGLNKHKEAENNANEIITNYKSSVNYYYALFLLGKINTISGNFDDANNYWNIITQDSVKAPKSLLQKTFLEIGNSKTKAKQYQQALIAYEQASKIKSDYTATAYYQAGVMAEKVGNATKASYNYLQAYQLSGNLNDQRAYIIGAWKSANIQNNYIEAIDLTKIYLSKYPQDNSTPYLLLSSAKISLDNLKDYKISIEFCEKLLNNFPKNEYVDDALFIIAKANKLLGNTDKAIETYESLLNKYPSSEFASEAQIQIEHIKAFDTRSREEGLQKLALLIGDVISEKSKGTLTYRLAEIYYSDLKDYKLAAEQYAVALNTNLDDELKQLALLKQAKSYELLAFKEQLENSNKSLEYSKKAIAIYDTIVTQFKVGNIVEQSIVSGFTLRLKLIHNAEEVKKLGAEFLSRSDLSAGRDIALLLLGNSYLNNKHFENALLTYKLLIEKYPNSEFSKTALYQSGVALDGMLAKDSAAILFKQFLNNNPNHAKSSLAAEYLAKYYVSKASLKDALEYIDILESRYYYHSIKTKIILYKADAYFAANEFFQASKLYKNYLELLRTDYIFNTADTELESYIIFQLGICNQKLNNISDAKTWYAEYISIDQSTEKAEKAYYALANFAKSENNVNLAAKYLQEVNRIANKAGGKKISISTETAEMLFQNEQYADAIPIYNEALSSVKDDTLKIRIYSKIITSYFRLDNIKEADKRVLEFKNNYPKQNNYFAEFEFERGKYELRKDNLEKAKDIFSKIIKSFPKTEIIPEVVFWTARIFELEQNYTQAIKLYDSLLIVFPKHIINQRVHLSLGNAYYNLEQWDSASKHYRIIVDNESSDPKLMPLAISNLILTYKEMGLYDGALELNRKYIDRYKNEPDVIDKKIDIGVLYQKLGYYDQSIVHLQNLIEAGNSDLEAELRYYIGEAYFYKGNYQQAILEFLKVPYLVNKRGKADWISTSYYMAGQSYERMSQYNKAITMYEQILSRKDTDTQFKTAAKKEIDRVKLIIKE